jgi:NAD+ synthase (glutamine-hydrolysing)
MKLCLGAASLNQTPLDWEGNRYKILEAIEKASNEEVSILCLPELCISGYGCEDFFLFPSVSLQSWKLLESILPACKVDIVLIGLPVILSGSTYNCCAVVVKKKIVGIVAKRNLPNSGVHYEPRWFKPFPKGEVTEFNGIPFGDILFETGKLRFGIEICEDAWVVDRPAIELQRYGVNIIFNPSASHFARNKIAVRRQIAQESSRRYNAIFVYANLLGCESGRTVYDGDSRIVIGGEIIAEATRFSFQSSTLTTAIVDVNQTIADQIPQSKVLAINNQKNLVKINDFTFSILNKPITIKKYQTEEDIYTEFTDVASLGLFDYLRKSRSKGYIVSLSGGADSAAVIVLAYLSLIKAYNKHGLNYLKTELSLPKHVVDIATLFKYCITSVYQATDNSSSTTFNVATQIANMVGSTHYNFDISPIVAKYIDIVEKSIGKSLSWEENDLALQNIQARVRSPSAWMLANVSNSLLLATGNRSEILTGYMTMDGDTSGGFSPIAGVDKFFILNWLIWLQTYDVKFAPLKSVTDQQPTAELRPTKQTDEADLMPYKVLAKIERYVILQRMDFKIVLENMIAEFSAEYDVNEIEAWIKRFYNLLKTSQWKRERLAIGLHLDEFSADSRTWLRYPPICNYSTQ